MSDQVAAEKQQRSTVPVYFVNNLTECKIPFHFLDDLRSRYTVRTEPPRDIEFSVIRNPATDKDDWREKMGASAVRAIKNYHGLLDFNNVLAMQRKGEAFARRRIEENLGKGKVVDQKIRSAQRILDGLEQAWATRPVDQPQTLYRGMHDLRAEQAAPFTQVGQVVQWNSWTSTTRNPAIAESFGKYGWKLNEGKEFIQFTIRAKSGMDVEGAGFFSREEEVLQRRGTKLRVVSATRVQTDAGSGWDVTVEEL